jgi:hypothetical protein
LPVFTKAENLSVFTRAENLSGFPKGENLSGFPKGVILSVLPKAEDLSVFPKAEGMSDFQVWDIGQVTVSNFDWLPFTPTSGHLLRSFINGGPRYPGYKTSIETLTFEVVNVFGPYHIILRWPCYVKVMTIPSYAYLKLKISGSTDVITLEART